MDFWVSHNSDVKFMIPEIYSILDQETSRDEKKRAFIAV